MKLEFIIIRNFDLIYFYLQTLKMSGYNFLTQMCYFFLRVKRPSKLHLS